ncbi:2-oxoisovalerate dehydrogenase E1 component [Maribacter vaceletii]|uniref:2-oxoisovalerate dehydrogenase E1 component n=1 Tax=Maribacter vaceletii TaxID=1206816 RepID=A0A495E994_9FLAO|nr:dehydrogenase E1 component subunit alpha/beta [Maribacter vaceletii]RKR13149.1 2-oxoisovalerate dehydrogenase E1 component [Maribacter vaceletii]
MNYSKYQISKEMHLQLYTAMLKPRMIEEKMLVLLRQGKISKWFSGIGQEAISVGVTSALKDNEYILPMHRNLGVFTTRNVPLDKLFAQWQGKQYGFTKGRDRSFHFGSQAHNIIGMISHLGPQLGVADGIALAHKLKNKKLVTAVFSGEGGTSEGDFHEALNLAAVWDLPVLFCVENNGYAISTPTNEQFKCKSIADKGIGYGIESYSINGNNILKVYKKVKKLAKSMRKNPRPILIEFRTFRVRGHEEASGTKYVPKKILKKWKAKDPLENYENYLINKNILSKENKRLIKNKIDNELKLNTSSFNAMEDSEYSIKKELADVFKKHYYQDIPQGAIVKNIRFVDAISEGLKQSMEIHDNLIIMGQDIAEYGGVFKITEGFVEKFGKNRIRNTPICESAIISAAMGLSINGMKAMVEMQFADFASSGFNSIVNYLAKSHYRWGQNADVVIRMPCGGGISAGPFHSQTNEAWFTKTPGLKVVYPAFPIDAKGLLATAINDPNPVLFFEHKALYRTINENVPADYYTTPFGKASFIESGEDITVVSYGLGVHWAIETLNNNSDINADLIDLRTLHPLDIETVYTSVKKTGRLIILQEDSLFGSISSDISALVTENCFDYLDAPIKRVASVETPIPFAAHLEENYLGKSRFETALLELLRY